MSLHEQLYQWTSKGAPDATSARFWRQGGGQGGGLVLPPVPLWVWLRLGAAALAMGLIGFGCSLWVAANWDTLGRPSKFALLQGLLVVSTLAAILRPTWRAPLALLAFFTLGGLLAFLGQTYQTGADPWMLFALWAALAVPLLLGAGSEWLWTPWVVVTSLAISLWTHVYAGRSWSADPGALPVHAVGLGASVLLSVAMALRARRRGHPWAWRMSVLTGAALALTLGLGALFGRHIGVQFWLILGVLAVALAGCWWRREVYAMSVLALTLNVLLVGWWVRGSNLNGLLDLFQLAGFAAVLLAGSVQLILRRARQTERAR